MKGGWRGRCMEFLWASRICSIRQEFGRRAEVACLRIASRRRRRSRTTTQGSGRRDPRQQNMHEFGLGATIRIEPTSVLFTITWTETRGRGSSGDRLRPCAAALCYGALGTDTGGSVRLPASFCGIVGLKPTYGRVSTRGVIPLSWSLDHVGPLTRTVLDAAMLLQAIAGYDAQETTSVDRAVPALMAAIKRRPTSLRIGVPRGYFFTGLQADVQTAVEQAIGVLSKLSAGVQDVVVPVSRT